VIQGATNGEKEISAKKKAWEAELCFEKVSLKMGYCMLQPPASKTFVLTHAEYLSFIYHNLCDHPYSKLFV
jgi:hypothetical protein